jgi:peptidoglycan hydrolase-like protein with peptidoglycan-binding domain
MPRLRFECRRHVGPVTRRTFLAGAAVAAVAVAAIGGGIVMSHVAQVTQAAREPSPNTAKVQKGRLSTMVSLDGTLSYRARLDGSAYSVINQAFGRYTELPEAGDKVECGDVFYRVDNRPVLLLCGTLPTYRDLYFGDVGKDVAQLNQNLHTLGYDARAGVSINPDDDAFTDNTERAFQVFQHDKGFRITGYLAIGDAVILPESARIASVTGDRGGVAQPGTPVASATSDTLEVQVDLSASQQGEVKQSDAARITLPGNRSVTGKVDRVGTVARVPDSQNSNKVGAATIPAFISLDDPLAAGGLDKAPVQVAITTDGVENALSVPVTALVGKSEGGYAVEVVRDGGQRALVGVNVGLFDTAGGRVQVDGDLVEGDQVVVPSL